MLNASPGGIQGPRLRLTKIDEDTGEEVINRRGKELVKTSDVVRFIGAKPELRAKGYADIEKRNWDPSSLAVGAMSLRVSQQSRRLKVVPRKRPGILSDFVCLPGRAMTRSVGNSPDEA